MKQTTVFGFVTVTVYYLLTTAIILYALNCASLYCNFSIILPVFPWAFILGAWFQGGIYWYFGATVINAVSLFFLSRYLAKLYQERHHRRELKEVRYHDENML